MSLIKHSSLNVSFNVLIKDIANAEKQLDKLNFAKVYFRVYNYYDHSLTLSGTEVACEHFPL